MRPFRRGMILIAAAALFGVASSTAGAQQLQIISSNTARYVVGEMLTLPLAEEKKLAAGEQIRVLDLNTGTTQIIAGADDTKPGHSSPSPYGGMRNDQTPKN